MESIKKQVENFLFYNKFASVATVYQGKPFNSKVRYASDGLNIFFATLKTTDKVQSILESPEVALTIDADGVDRFIQYYGNAILLNSQAEISDATRVISRVYKYVKYWRSEPNVMYFRIEPVSIKYTIAKRTKPEVGSFFGDVYVLDEKNNWGGSDISEQ